jgi:endonuclease YncB( thermonuclease family)
MEGVPRPGLQFCEYNSAMTRPQRLILIGVGLLALLLLSSGIWLVWGRESPPAPFLLTPATLTANSPAVSAIPANTDTPSPEPSAAVTATLQVVSAPASPTLSVFDPLSCLPGGDGEDGRVMEVLPDAALRVELDQQTVDVRLLGADPAGSGGQALGLLRELVEGKPVKLLRDLEEVDTAGNPLRYIVVDGLFLNYELVRRGAALPALYPPGQRCSETMLAGEKLARAEGLGYWSLRPEAGVSVLSAATPTGLACDCTRVYQCTDFTSHAAAQACYNACGDYRNADLDDDHNGLACEQLP